jgi:electron transfer flavoprotein alpha subunit
VPIGAAYREGVTRPLRVAALVKQIPAFEVMEIGDDGRLRREGVPLEMSAYCRRAVAQGVALAQATGGSCTVITLGPPSAEDVLREALTYGADDAVLISDPAFAGSDTLATARALAAALEHLGSFDLVLVGRNSVDAETGQVGPQLAELLDLPFATGIKQLELVSAADGASAVRVGCEQDDAWLEATVELPAILSTAERLIDPCKVKDPELLAAVDADRIRHVTADELGPGPWGQDGSPTTVGEVRIEPVTRRGERLAGPVGEQIATVVAALVEHGLVGSSDSAASTAARAHDEVARPPAVASGRPLVAVVVEPGRQRVLRELLGTAASLAATSGGHVVAIGESVVAPDPLDHIVAAVLDSWGADEVVVLQPSDADGAALVEEDVAREVARWAASERPDIVIAPSTAWGREVAGRVAARLGAGLTGDAIGLELNEGGRLVAWKPAFGGVMVAAIEASSEAQLVTVRPGVLELREPRAPRSELAVTTVDVSPRGRVAVTAHRRDDDLDVLASARRVVTVGRGVEPADYAQIEALADALGAELGATRKVTDVGWLPHSRQVGITGQNLAPELAVVIGASGKFNHMVGLRRAGLVVAINPDPEAPVFGFADYGVVADWRDAVPELEAQVRAQS